jgi:hypothetical protein
MPEDVVLLGNYVAEIDADPELDRLFEWRARVAFSHASLHLDGAAYGIDHARELAKEAVTSILYDPAPVLLDLRLNQLPEVRFEPFVCPFLIRPHQARVPRHVGSEDRGEAADRGHDLSGGRLA